MSGSHDTSTKAFANRREAGEAVAHALAAYAGRDDLVVLALPRGGVPVAREVAHALNAPLDVFVVRKLGTPGHRELAMGAIASGGVRVLNEEILRWYGFSAETIDRVAEEEQRELERREHAYREGRPAISVLHRIVMLVDDGLATGASMKAAVQAVRRLEPAKVIVAVPVGARDTCGELRSLADEVVCVRTPEPFSAVGLWYHDFDQTSDQEVRELLRSSATP